MAEPRCPGSFHQTQVSGGCRSRADRRRAAVRDELELKRLAVSRLGKQVIDVVDVDAGYADADGTSKQVLTDVTWLIGAGDRYGLLGENGAGKSTLLDVIQGKIAPLRGRVKIGQTVRFGVLSQQLEELEPYMGDTIREVLGNYKKYYVIDGKETSPEKLCERLGFTTQQLWSRIGDLSGGQRRRPVAAADDPGRAQRAYPGRARQRLGYRHAGDCRGLAGRLARHADSGDARPLFDGARDRPAVGAARRPPDAYARAASTSTCACATPPPRAEPVGAPSAKTGTFDTGAAALRPKSPSRAVSTTAFPMPSASKLRRECEPRSSARWRRQRASRGGGRRLRWQRVEPHQLHGAGRAAGKDRRGPRRGQDLEMAWLEASEKLEGEE